MIQKIKKYLQQKLQSNFSKHIAMMLTGNFLAQVLAIAFYPLITRLYKPVDFGVYVLFNSITGVIASLGALKMENAIVIAKNKTQAINVMFLALSILLGIALLMFIFLFLWGDLIGAYFNVPALIPYKYFIVLAVLFTGVYSILNQWAYRANFFKKLSITKISRSISLNVSQSLLAFLFHSPLGLIFGKVIGEASGNFVLIKSSLLQQPNLFQKINVSSWKSLLFRYKKFLMYSSTGQLIIKAGMELPVFFIGLLYGSETLGQFGLAYSIISLPVTLIGNAVGDVFYAEAAKTGKTSPVHLKKLSFKLLKQLSMLASVPVLFIVFLGPNLFTFIFGKQWLMAGEFAQVIVFFVFFRLIFNPLTRIFEVFEKQITNLFIAALRIFLVFVVYLLVKIFKWDAYNFVWLYTLAMAFIYLFTYFVSIAIIKQQIVVNQKNNAKEF